ncbi:MAG: Holliday junction branch migration protein RuvA [Chitinophagales bacterium]|nr:Holliday junction branch migration protein RuvA [Chitinophagales bacterium]MDW8419472.1 Holliday junction branch migration protein RuvA [Chitinophagales bacterium]
MIAYLRGKITYKCPTHLLLETGGVGFLLKISLYTYERVQALEQCTLHTYLVVRHEGQSVAGFDLYGFYDETERDLFDKLLSVSGIGAATARMMLSSYKPEEICHAIATENEVLIQSIKGIGPKSAKRIILELKDKVSKPETETLIPATVNNKLKEEALSALVALGFAKPAADKTLNRLMASGIHQNVETLIKEALKLL